MKQQPDLTADDRLGDFDALLAQLDRESDRTSVESGYVALLSRLGSSEFRKRYPKA